MTRIRKEAFLKKYDYSETDHYSPSLALFTWREGNLP